VPVIDSICTDAALNSRMHWFFFQQVCTLSLIAVMLYRVFYAKIESPFNGSFDFKNNAIVPKTDFAFIKKIALESWNGVLLATCSVFSLFWSLYSLLPAFYASHCTNEQTLTQTDFPGASIAVLETYFSAGVFFLVAEIFILLFLFQHLPIFCLQTLPKIWRRVKI